jgi:hypothetical protein
MITAFTIGFLAEILGVFPTWLWIGLILVSIVAWAIDPD